MGIPHKFKGYCDKGRTVWRTYAYKDIAFASWVSPQFKLYLIKEFERLKKEEQALLGWSVKRELAKINYRIHTDAIKVNLIPLELTPQQTCIIYASEADVEYGIIWHDSETMAASMRC